MNQTGIKKRIPIRTRFLATLLLTTVISILAVSLTGFFTIRWARNAAEETLTEQLEQNLRSVIRERVGAVDAKLAHYENYIRLITDTIENLYRDEEKAVSSGSVFGPPRDTKEFALTRAFASDRITPDDLQREMLFYSNLKSVLEPIAKENEDLITTVYLGTKNGLLMSYDRYSYLSVPPADGELVYNYYVSEWYQRGMRENGILYTGVYMDAQGRGLTVTIASGYTDREGRKAGVACLDYDLRALYEQMFSDSLDERIFAFALDGDGTVISPESDTMDLRGYTGLTLDQLDALRSDPDGIMPVGDRVYVCVPMERVGWTVCACVPLDVIRESIHKTDAAAGKAFAGFTVAVLLILVAAVVAVNHSVHAITYPLELLRKDIQTISDGDLNHRASFYRNDEIGDITSGINEMVDRLNTTMEELVSSQQHADAMQRLATRDALTGVRNKTAFDRQTEILTEKLDMGGKNFGFAMVDLNNLKVINDNFGHDKGDLAIKKLCSIICEVFSHSPVFRVGGDEFVIVLENQDYENIDQLVTHFKDRLKELPGDKKAQPWVYVSGALGYALYDENLDNGTESVLARADKEMYTCKKAMKNS